MKKCFFARPKCHASIHRSNKTTKQSNALKDEITIVSPIKEKSMMSTELDLRLQSPEWEEGGPKSCKWFKIKHLKSSWPDLRSKIQCGLLVTWVMWRTRPKEEKSRVLVELTWKKRLLCDLIVKGAYLIFVLFFTQANFLENEIYTEKHQFFALNL